MPILFLARSFELPRLSTGVVCLNGGGGGGESLALADSCVETRRPAEFRYVPVDAVGLQIGSGRGDWSTVGWLSAERAGLVAREEGEGARDVVR